MIINSMNSIKFISLSMAIVIGLAFATTVSAQPYGIGIYDSILPYGDETSLSISANGNILIPITPTVGNNLGKSTNVVTITSTDIIGYKLYIRSLANTYLENGSSQIPASANITPLALTTNTWGYNIDNSDSFLGITNSDVLIKASSYPTPSGENTNVTFGVNVDLSKASGNYSAGVVYTVVPQTY